MKQVFVVTCQDKLVAICSSKDEVVRMFGTSWAERVTVYDVALDVPLNVDLV